MPRSRRSLAVSKPSIRDRKFTAITFIAGKLAAGGNSLTVVQPSISRSCYANRYDVTATKRSRDGGRLQLSVDDAFAVRSLKPFWQLDIRLQNTVITVLVDRPLVGALTKHGVIFFGDVEPELRRLRDFIFQTVH